MDARRAGQRRDRQRADRRAARRRRRSRARSSTASRAPRHRPKRSTCCSPSAAAARSCDRAGRSTKTSWSAGSSAASPAPAAARRYHDQLQAARGAGRVRRLRLDRVQAPPRRQRADRAHAHGRISRQDRADPALLRSSAGWSAGSTAWRRSKRSRRRSTRYWTARPPRASRILPGNGEGSMKMRSPRLRDCSAPASARAPKSSAPRPTASKSARRVQLVVPPDAGLRRVRQIVAAGGIPSTPTAATPPTCSLALSPAAACARRSPDGGGIEHMRVVYVEPGKRLMLTGALGPLLYEATTGVMDVTGRADRRRLAADARLSRRGLRQGRRRQARAGGRPGAGRPDEALPRLRDRAAAAPLGALQRHEAERRRRPPPDAPRSTTSRHRPTVRGSSHERVARRRPRALRSARSGRPAAGTARRSRRRRSPRSARRRQAAAPRRHRARPRRPRRASRVARQDDVPPPGKQPGQAVERLAPHDHRAAHGQRLEALEIGGDVPRQRAVAADDAVLRARDDEGDRRPVHAPALAGVRAPAKRAIAPA